MLDLYQILGVPYDAPTALIRARYRLLAFRMHPDTAGGHALSSFTEYVQASKVLGNPQRRQQYNTQIGVTAAPRSLRSGYALYQRVTISALVAEKGGVADLTFVRDEPCSLCWLEGCHRCQNQGMVQQEVHVKVKIPAHTRNNAMILVEGEGGVSEPGGSRGNLFVYVFIV